MGFAVYVKQLVVCTSFILYSVYLYSFLYCYVFNLFVTVVLVIVTCVRMCPPPFSVFLLVWFVFLLSQRPKTRKMYLKKNEIKCIQTRLIGLEEIFFKLSWQSTAAQMKSCEIFSSYKTHQIWTVPGTLWNMRK